MSARADTGSAPATRYYITFFCVLRASTTASAMNQRTPKIMPGRAFVEERNQPGDVSVGFLNQVSSEQDGVESPRAIRRR